MPQDLAEIHLEQPQKEHDYQEYTELQNLDGFRFEAGHTFSVTQSRVIQVWQLSMTPAWVPVSQ